MTMQKLMENLLMTFLMLLQLLRTCWSRQARPWGFSPCDWVTEALVKTGRRDELSSPKEANEGLYDNFSETQTDSQVVGYEEDLTGRQMLIDRVRTRSSMA
uniref:Uncharacterized protein n=1 Tax=Salix viminalis TaxID=40686 RepID=A0A6N2LTK4_SALVM